MRKYGSSNSFVIFPSKCMEDEWLSSYKEQRPLDELRIQFEQLLETAKSEQEVHEFFEIHPQLLPDIAHYHNGPRGDIVVTKLPLGLDFVTDFAFVSENSQMVQFTCIEIESPRKRLFTKGSSFSRDYLDAKQQIMDWNVWGQQNVKEATRLFGRLGSWLPEKHYHISLHCVLVMGRRSEISTVKQKQRWAAEHALRHASMSIMTYDRLIERMESRFDTWHEKMLVCSYRDRALHVKRISL